MRDSGSGEFVANGDQLIPQEQVMAEQQQAQQQQLQQQHQVQQQQQHQQQQYQPPQQHQPIHQAIYPHAQPIRNIPPPPIQTQSQVVVEEPVRTPRRRPDPIVLAPESRFQRQETVTTPPESPVSTAAYGNVGSPTPFSPPYQSYNSVVGTPTSANFAHPSPSLRSEGSYANSGYGGNTNRYSWSLLDSASTASSFVSSPAEARTPKFGRRQTVATPSLNGVNVFAELEGQQPTPAGTEPLGSGYNSPRSSIQSPRQPPIPPPPPAEEHYGGGYGGSSRPKTWHGGPPPNLMIPNTPSPPVPTNPATTGRRILLPVLNREPGSRSNRNSQIYNYNQPGQPGRPTLEPEILPSGSGFGQRSQADLDALKALGQMAAGGHDDPMRGHRRTDSQAEKRKSGVWDQMQGFDLKNVKMQKRSSEGPGMSPELDSREQPPPPPLPTVIAPSSRVPRRGVAEKRLSITSPITDQQRQIANYSTYGSLATRPVMSPQQSRRPVSMYDILSQPVQPMSIASVAGLHSMSASPTPSQGSSHGGPVRMMERGMMERGHSERGMSGMERMVGIGEGVYREERRMEPIRVEQMREPLPRVVMGRGEVPRSISDERTPGMGGLCALVSAVELQGRNG
ncbi:hypothetical protein BJ508DRAFT_335164 [Ascobolus immersus RN42]|uniref:Uncharacterized protein n=1 Tax=Ascobolus immersus RN42 TaxID=1160509 RepID=A0A3N4HDF8_ASCIM|nr:hypothetical protein BJ508DRAFT_335164 [Ascobolus immersus RN42]